MRPRVPPTPHEFTTALGWPARVSGQAETTQYGYDLGPLLGLCALVQVTT